ncbi:MAG: GNAT family N-acetyltransferase [Pseudomonadales bacterium]|jgi:ribosomal protein S18 acetylase RimI-like enzyme|nr:GNAT family N-acetyltransferase [Pseudomonadales bacterium]
MQAHDFKEIIIRRSTLEDSESFQRCLDTVARERKWLTLLEAPNLEEVRTFIPKLSVQFVAITQGTVVGWCDISIPRKRDGFCHCGVLGMGLLPEFRRRGLGERLLRATIDAAHANGLSRIELEVYASNHAAIRLYERLGFAHEGRRRQARILDGQVEDNLCMALVLAGQDPPYGPASFSCRLAQNAASS